MKLKEMVELVQQHHSDLGVTEIVKMLNISQEEYSQRTRMLERATQFDLDGNNAQRYYALDESIPTSNLFFLSELIEFKVSP